MTLLHFRPLCGTYRVQGYTINSSDGNKTYMNDMTLRLENGRLSGSGSYNSGSSYNAAMTTSWSGTYSGNEIQWTERYGDSEYVFNYRGTIESNKLRGTYNWTYNSAVGTFEFTLEQLPE